MTVATFDPVYKGSESTLSNGNRTVTKNDSQGASVTWSTAVGDVFRLRGKYYFEVEVTDSLESTYVGIGRASTPLTNSPVGVAASSMGVGFFCDKPGGVPKYYILDQRYVGTTIPPVEINSTLPSLVAGQRCMVAVDITAQTDAKAKVWFGINGVWEGDPAAGTGYVGESISYAWISSAVAYTPAVSQLLTGQEATISLDASQFLHTVPAGFEAWGSTPTLNPLTKSPAVTLTGGNLSAEELVPTNRASGSVHTTTGRRSGKYYFEIGVSVGTLTSSTSIVDVGGLSTAQVVYPPTYYEFTRWCGNFEDGRNWGVRAIASATYSLQMYSNRQRRSATFTPLYPISSEATYCFAVDFDEGYIWFGVNGEWDGDPNTNLQYRSNEDWEINPNPLDYDSRALFPTVSIFGNGAPHKNTIRLTANDFAHYAPDGYLAWDGTTPVYAPAEWPLEGTWLDTTDLFTAIYCPVARITNNFRTATARTSIFGEDLPPIGPYAIPSTTPQSTGKLYFEITLDRRGNTITHIGGIGQDVGPVYNYYAGTFPISKSFGLSGSTASGWGVWADRVRLAVLPTAITQGDVVMFAVDFDAGRCWYGINGVWNGNPATNTLGSYTYTFTPNMEMNAYVSGIYGSRSTINFGFFDFAYAIPGGFAAWQGGSPVPPGPAPQPVTGMALDPGFTNVNGILSNGNLSYEWNLIGSSGCSYGNTGRDTGKYYFEIVNTTASGTGGAGYSNWGFGGGISTTARSILNGVFPGSNSTSWGFSNRNTALVSTDSTTWFNNVKTDRVGVAQIPQGGYLGVAVDLDAGKVWFNANGTWIASGNPAAGTSPVYTFTANTMMYPAVGQGSSSPFGKSTINFGATSFIGTTPSGFLAWNLGGSTAVDSLNPDPEVTSSTLTLTNNNLTFEGSINAWYGGKSNYWHTTGKKYFEITNDANGLYEATICGLSDASADFTTSGNYVGNYIANTVMGKSWGIWANRSAGVITYGDDTAVYLPDTPITTGGRTNVAVDFDAGKMWFGLNGSWVGSGNPASGANPTYTFPPNAALYAAISVYDVGQIATLNLGASVFTDTVPSGFSSWNTGILEVVTWDTGNIEPAITLSNGNLTAERTAVIASPYWYGVVSTNAYTEGKKYFEITQDVYSPASMAVGLAKSFLGDGYFPTYMPTTSQYLGFDNLGWGLRINDPGVTPTTFDPVNSSPNMALTGGNLTVKSTSSALPIGQYYGAISTTARNSGKVYFEVTQDVYLTQRIEVGLVTGTSHMGMPSNSYIGSTAGGYGVDLDWSGNTLTLNNSTSSTVGTGLTANGDVLGIAVDFTTGKWWVRKNGVWGGCGGSWGAVINDPVAGTGGSAFSFTPGATLYAAVALNGTTVQVTGNFGATPFAYAAPTGFTAWDSLPTGTTVDLYHNSFPTTINNAPLLSNGDVVGVATDFDAGKAWFSFNGTWIGSGDPAAGTNPAFTFTPNTPLLASMCFYDDVAQATVNFGATTFAETTPSGFEPWQGLGGAPIPEPPNPNPPPDPSVVEEVVDGTWNVGSSVTFKLWVDKELIFETPVSDSEVFRLPTGYKSDTFEVGIESDVRIRSIHVAETPTGLKEV